ncbi:peptidyl-prolyl cis-trans isomerase [candidate division KSB1 bacterium]
MKRFFLFVFSLTFLSCSGNKSSTPPVARVGDATLTLDMIENVLSSDNRKNVGFDEKKNYVERWVERELLYSEAENKGFGNDQFIRDELLNLEKDLIVDRLIDIEVDGKLDVSEEEIMAYYKDNSSEFLFFENEYKYEEIRVRAQGYVGTIENALKAKKTFTEISREIRQVSFVHRVTDNGYTKEGSVPQNILKTLSKLKIAEWKRVKLPDGYHFLYLIDKRNAGEVKELSLIKNDIILRILAGKRKMLYKDLIKRLKEKTNIVVNYSEIGFLGGAEYTAQDTVDSPYTYPDTTENR